MKIPRLKMRKSTKGTLAGILIALGSLYALAISYNIPRETLIGFLVGSILFVLAMMVFAIGIVTISQLIIRLFRKDDQDEH